MRLKFIRELVSRSVAIAATAKRTGRRSPAAAGGEKAAESEEKK